MYWASKLRTLYLASETPGLDYFYFIDIRVNSLNNHITQYLSTVVGYNYWSWSIVVCLWQFNTLLTVQVSYSVLTLPCEQTSRGQHSERRVSTMQPGGGGCGWGAHTLSRQTSTPRTHRHLTHGSAIATSLPSLCMRPECWHPPGTTAVWILRDHMRRQTTNSF